MVRMRVRKQVPKPKEKGKGGRANQIGPSLRKCVQRVGTEIPKIRTTRG